MHSLAHYALLGSLLAGAAGALVLITLTIQHGLKRRAQPDATPEEAAARVRLVRLADSIAVACFAVAAGLGVVGLMHHTRPTPFAHAAGNDGKVGERLHALEARLASAELTIQRRASAPELRAWEDRLARLETRLGAVEDRAAVAERRAVASEQLARERREERVRVASAPPPRRVVTPAPAASKAVAAPPVPVPSASPRLAPVGGDAAHAPEPPLGKPEATVPAAPTPVSSAPAPVPALGSAPSTPAPGPVASAPPIPSAPQRERPRDDGSPADLPLGEKLRQDWSIIRKHVERGGDEWRDGWRQLKSLFGY